jgi:predicted MPP superfamily phosphohydrolase
MQGGENYDGRFDEYKERLESLGVHFLVNEQVRISHMDENLVITGLVIGRKYFKKLKQPKLNTEYLQNLVGIADKQCYNILIAHNPVYFSNYIEWGADLIVSGHIHGGIIRLPAAGGVISPQYKFFPKYDAGKFETNERTMLVSRGLGLHTIKIRVFNRPELMVVTLERKL